MLEFLDDEEDWRLRAGAVLSDEVYLLQFSYRRGGEQQVCALCGGGLRGDSGAWGVVEGVGNQLGKWPLGFTRGKRVPSDEWRAGGA